MSLVRTGHVARPAGTADHFRRRMSSAARGRRPRSVSRRHGITSMSCKAVVSLLSECGLVRPRLPSWKAPALVYLQAPLAGQIVVVILAGPKVRHCHGRRSARRPCRCCDPRRSRRPALLDGGLGALQARDVVIFAGQPRPGSRARLPDGHLRGAHPAARPWRREPGPLSAVVHPISRSASTGHRPAGPPPRVPPRHLR